MSYPVTSFQQRRLDWLATADRIGWSGPINLNHRAYLAAGQLDLDALTHACDIAAARHEALRVSFTAQPDGRWTATTIDQPPTALRVAPPADSSSAATAEAVTAALIARHKPFGPAHTPRFQVHVTQLDEHRTAVVVTADRIVADDHSLGILTRTIGDAYNPMRRRSQPQREPDSNWRRHAVAAGQTLDQPRPADWIALQDDMATHGAHASTALPVRLPFNQYPDRLEIGTTTLAVDTSGLAFAAARADVDPFVLQLAAIAGPITTHTRKPVWIYLYPDLRQPHERGTVGPYTARTLVHVPPRTSRCSDHLRIVQQRYDEARGPGVIWTDRIHEHAGANQAPPRHPSLAITAAPPTAELALADVETTPLHATTLDLGPGRIVYEIDDTTLHIHHEHGRYPDNLMNDLAQETSDALAALVNEL